MYHSKVDKFNIVDATLLKPDTLVNSRIGNGLGDYHCLDDNEITDEYMVDGCFETPATLNDTWGYLAFDQNWKNADEIIRIKNHLNSRGINYLLNIGPDYLGRFPAPSIDILRKVGDGQVINVDSTKGLE